MPTVKLALPVIVRVSGAPGATPSSDIWFGADVPMTASARGPPRPIELKTSARIPRAIAAPTSREDTRMKPASRSPKEDALPHHAVRDTQSQRRRGMQPPSIEWIVRTAGEMSDRLAFERNRQPHISQ